MKFLIFSDLHHYPGVFMGGTWDDLTILQRRAEDEQCEFLIHCGDFCHGPALVPDYVKAYNDFHIPSYHCLGNHDTDKTPLADTLKAYRMPADHYFFDCKGYRFIICNPNYFYANGEYVPYDMGNYYKFKPYRDYMPPEQLKWLAETISGAPGPCILLSHESFEREADGVKNFSAVREIINAANRRKPHSVLMCINGHYHRNNLRILDNVCYFDLNSASYDWVDNAHDLFPAALCDEIRLMNHTVVYNDPLYAVITLEGTTITIDGIESSLFMGIAREMTGNDQFDCMGREAVPSVLSAKLTVE